MVDSLSSSDSAENRIAPRAGGAEGTVTFSDSRFFTPACEKAARARKANYRVTGSVKLLNC